jgi:hypothetical protein
MLFSPSLIDASLFHLQLRLHVGGVDHPHLRASLVSLTCQQDEGARPQARLSFVHSTAAPERGDLTHPLRTIPLGTGVDIAHVGDDGHPLSLFAGTVAGRGLQATEGGMPQLWIACEGADEMPMFEGRTQVPLSFGGQISAVMLGEQIEAAAPDMLPGRRERHVVRGEVSVGGWLTAVPGDTIELRNTGDVFDGPVQVLAVTQRSDSQGTTTVLTVQRS